MVPATYQMEARFVQVAQQYVRDMDVIFVMVDSRCRNYCIPYYAGHGDTNGLWKYLDEPN